MSIFMEKIELWKQALEDRNHFSEKTVEGDDVLLKELARIKEMAADEQRFAIETSLEYFPPNNANEAAIAMYIALDMLTASEDPGAEKLRDHAYTIFLNVFWNVLDNTDENFAPWREFLARQGGLLSVEEDDTADKKAA